MFIFARQNLSPIWRLVEFKTYVSAGLKEKKNVSKLALIEQLKGGNIEHPNLSRLVIV